MKLAEQGEELALELAFWLQGLDNPQAKAESLGKLSLELGEKLRALAIITLLVKAESDFFFHNLIRSARAREIYLQRVKAAGLLEDHHRVLGRYQPVLDAIAAGDLERVRRIRALSPAEFRPGHEYEDDHWYAQVLHELCEATPDEGKFPAMLEAFDKSLGGVDPSRLQVCQALVARDQDGFAAAFEALLAQHTAQIAKDKARGKLEDPATVAQRQVFVEGLAVLRLAERRGLTTLGDYLYCPSLARVPMVAPFPGE
jgi:hypothetical protein